MTRLRRSARYALALAALALGCPGGDGGGVGGVLVVANVEVAPGIADVILGQTQQLTATPRTSSGVTVTGRSIGWSTTDGTIATVSSGGLVTAVGIGGPVRIRATVDGVVGDAVITVKPIPIDHVTVTPPNANVLVQGQVTLTAKAFSATNVELPGRSFLWESTDHSIATVTTTGLVLGVREGGPVTITATAENKSGTSLVSVSNRPATRLGFAQQPGLSIAGTAMAPAVRVALQDDFLATVVGAPNPVTIQLAGNPGGATLSGQLTVTPQNGIATFSNLSLNKVGTAYTFLVTSPGLVEATSIPFDVIAGSANQLAFTTAPPTTAQSGVALVPQPVLQLKDNSGNNVAQANVAVTVSIASGPAGATLGGAVTVNTSAAGVASFGNLSLSGPTGSYTLSFAAAGVTPLGSAPLTLSAGSAATLAITTQPSSSAQSNTPLAQQPAIQVKDAAGNNVALSGVTVTATIASGGGAVAGNTTAVTSASGLASFSGLAISGAPGSYTLDFSAPGLGSVSSAAITLGAGSATQLSITTQPSALAASGAVFAVQPVLQLRDAANNPVAQANVSITAAIATGGGTLGGATTVLTNASGVASFTNLSITGTAGDRTLSFSSGSLTPAGSGVITVTAGAASQLSITTQPSSSVANGAVLAQQPVIQLRDAANNVVAQAGVVVTAAISTGGGTLGGTLTATTNGAGVATFSNLSITGTVGARTLIFSASGFTSVTSGSVTVTAGPATQLSFTQQPSSSASSGQAFATQPILLLRDASNNPVAGVVVTATITGAPAGVTRIGTTTATTDAAGLASFAGSGLGLSGPVGSYTLTFTAGAVSSPPSGSIALGAGTATQLTYTQQPSTTANSGQAFATQPILLLRDAANNPVAGVVITATVTGSPAGVTRIGTTTATTNASGVATFVGSGLGLSGPVGSYTLTFTAGALSSAASNSIALSAGTATQLTYNTQPSATATSGQAFAQAPALLLRDAANNPVAGVVVTASITGSPAGVSLVGSATATTNGSGVATFTGLGLSGPAGTYTLRFTAGAVTSANSNNIVLSAGTATQLSYTTQPSSSANSGQAFGTQPVLLLRDAASNPVAGGVVTATITGSPAGVSLIGSITATSNASGLATFSGLGLSGPVGSYTLTFTAGAVTSPASNNITLSAGTATQLTYNTQPSSSAVSGVAFGTQPALLLRDAANNPVSGTVITATITGSPAGVSFVGTTTATTNGSGIATFSGLGLSGPAGSYTLTFAAGAVSSGASNSITLSAGGGTQLTYNTQPSTTANSGQPFGTQPVLLLRDASNNPVSGVTVTATITGSPAGASLIGGTTASTNGSGIATFSGLGISGPVGSYTLTFTTGTATSVASNGITLSAGTATQLTYTQQPSTTANSGVAFAQEPILQLRDAANNPVLTSGVVVTATITGSPAGMSLVGTVTATTSASGVATFVGTGLGLSGPAGNYTLTFTAGLLSSPASSTIALSAGGANNLTYVTQPSTTANSGQPFTTEPVLLLRDAANNPITGATVTASITGAPAGASLVGTVSAVTNGSGRANFNSSGLGISGPVGNYTLTFTSGAVSSAASNTIALSAGTATQLTYSTQPSSGATSGLPFSQQPVLLLRDGANNPVSGTVITATITGAPAGVSLIGTTTATTNGSGLATFSGLGLNGPSGSYTLTFTGASLSSGASTSITLGAGGATQMSFSVQPSTTANSGVEFGIQPALLLEDASNNPVSGAVVTATITGAPAGASLFGTTTATTNGSGIATFSNLGLDALAGGYTLTFTSGAVSSPASNSISLSAGPPTQLGFSVQPSASATSGQAFGTVPVLLLRDSGNNPIGGTLITATITGSPAGVAFVGTTTATTSGTGLATFTGLGLSGPTGSYTLTFTGASLSSGPSSSIALSAGGATQVTYNQQPSATAQSGAAFGTQPILLARDASSNPVPGTLVTASITGAPAGTSLAGTATVTTDGAGLATFTDLGINGPVGSYTLTFTSGSATSAASNSIALSVGAPTQLTYNTQPSTTASSGDALAAQPALLLRDSGNNPVVGTVVTATLTGAPAGVSLTGTTTATTNGSGVATFSDLGLSGTAGTYTLTFTAPPSVSSAASNGIALTAGTPTQLTYTTQPSTTTSSGAAFGQQPVLLLQDASNNPVNGMVITATITGAPAGVSFVGATTATTNASGLATFTNLGLSGPVGSYTLTFTGASLSSAASNSIALGVGAPTQLTYNTQPSTPVSNGSAFGTQPVLLLRDSGGNPVASTAITATITGAPAGVSLVGTPTATTNGSGVATFVDLGLSGTAGTYTLTFTAPPSVSSAASNSIALTAGTPTQLTYTTQPSTTASSGLAFGQQPVLLLQDASNNPVGGVIITATITGAPAGVTFVGTTTATTNGSGLATFTDLGLSGTAGSYTLTFTGAALTSAASNAIALGAGTPSQLSYDTQPSTSVNSGNAFATAPVLLLQDAANNPVPSTLVTATITGAPAGVTLVGTPTATTDNSGLATFTGLGLSGPVGNYTLTFTAGVVTSAASNTIAVTPGQAAQLTITQQPVGGASGGLLTTQPVVAVQDAQGNTVTADNATTVSVAIASGAGGTLGGTTTNLTVANGVATFTDLTLAGTVGTDYTLQFTSPSTPALTAATSGNLNVTPGPAAQLTITVEPAPASPGDNVVFSTQPTIQVRDAQGNAVATGTPVTITAELVQVSGSGTLLTTLTADTGPSGAATFTDLKITGSGTFRIKFKSGALTEVTTATLFTVP